jgi:hypothetical protein
VVCDHHSPPRAKHIHHNIAQLQTPGDNFALVLRKKHNTDTQHKSTQPHKVRTPQQTKERETSHTPIHLKGR